MQHRPVQCPAGASAHMTQHWPGLPSNNPLAAALLGGPSTSGGSSAQTQASHELAASSSDAFPVDFFESCSAITMDVRLSGDVAHVGEHLL